MSDIVKGNIIIPKNVSNREAYIKWLELSKNPLLTEESHRLIQTSDPAIKIDLAAFPAHIYDKISHLPLDEQNAIKGKVSALTLIRRKIKSLAQEAFPNYDGGFMEENNYLEPRKAELIELFGCFHTVDDVYKILNKEWGLPTTKETIKKFLVSYSDRIKQAQEDFKRDYSHVRLGYKSSRLEEYSYMYYKIKEEIEESEKVNPQLIKANVDILKNIKEEVEGSELNININGEVNVNHSIQGYINNEVINRLQIQCIVLTKISSRFSMNTTKLLHDLQTSIYAKHLGIIKSDVDINEIESMFPSEHIYEFDKLKRMNEMRNIEDAQIITDDEKSNKIDANRSSEADTIRKALLGNLKVRKDEVNKASIRIKIKKSENKEEI